MPGRRLRRLALLAVAAVAVGIGVIVLATGALDDVERASVDARFDVRGTQKPPRGIVVVEVDDTTFNELRGERWPFRRSLHAQLIRRLTKDGARAIAYDVQFTEPTNPADDGALLDAVAGAPRVVLSTTEVDKRGGTRVFGGDKTVREVRARVGNTVIDPDADGVLRHFRRTVDRLASFPVVAAERVTGKPVGRDGFEDGEAWIDYAGPPDTVKTVSFSRALSGKVPAGVFKNKIVLVGAGAPSLNDVHATPLSGRQLSSGVEIWANAIQSLLDDLPLRSTPDWLGVLLVVLLGLVAPLAALRFSPLRTLAIAVGAAALYAVGAQIAFDSGAVAPVVAPLVALVLGTLGALGVAAFFAALDRERTRAQFARFVPERVVEDVLAQAGGARLGGVRAQATVLYCDLRGSTALLEGMTPERGIDIVNRYLTAMTDAVIAHGGTLSGFRGDGLLALFGVPLEQSDHADRAVAAAREMAGERLARLNEDLQAEGLEAALQIGVGVCSGEIMAGNVGSEQRMEYTAIGDAANVAARLEAMTKGSGHAVFIADATRALLADGDGLVAVGDLEVRGRAARITTWTLAAS